MTIKNKSKQAFTLVELIVVITILAILGTIAFISIQGYSKQARDSRRISDVNNIRKSLELFQINTGVYPLPDNGGEVAYSGELLWTQGTFGDRVTKNLSKNLSKKPLDPLYELEYTYSVSNYKNEYQVMAYYESDLTYEKQILGKTYAKGNLNVKLNGNYNELFVKTSSYIIPIPSIITSEELPLDLQVKTDGIKSQVITGGKNFPKRNVGGIKSSTGKLDINLNVASKITKDSTDEEKEAAINAMQSTYSGTVLANKHIYKNVINTTDKSGLAEMLIINKGKIISTLGESNGNGGNSGDEESCEPGYVWDGDNCLEVTDESYFTFDSTTGEITDYDVAGGLDVVIPSSIGGVEVTSIGGVAFRYKNLTSVVFPNTLVSIGSRAFVGSSLKTIKFPLSLKIIENAAFRNNSLTTITIPSNIESIGGNSFNGNNITSVKNYDGYESSEYLYLPYGGGIEIITYIGNSTSVNIPNSINGKTVLSIGQYSFRDKSLTSIDIPNSITNIGNDAFANNSLTSVNIGSGINSIGSNAFGYQTNSTGNGIVYAPSSFCLSYYNATYFDTDKLERCE